MSEKTIKEKTSKSTNGIQTDGEGKEYLSRGYENNYGLTNEQLIYAYKSMLTSRFIDDRTDMLIKQGKATFLISGSGHEAIQVACAIAMKAGKDWYLSM